MNLLHDHDSLVCAKTTTINNLTLTNEENFFIYLLSAHFVEKFELFCNSFDFIRMNIFISVNKTFVPKTTQQKRRNIPKIINIIHTNLINYIQSPGER